MPVPIAVDFVSRPIACPAAAPPAARCQRDPGRRSHWPRGIPGRGKTTERQRIQTADSGFWEYALEPPDERYVTKATTIPDALISYNVLSPTKDILQKSTPQPRLPLKILAQRSPMVLRLPQRFLVQPREEFDHELMPFSGNAPGCERIHLMRQSLELADEFMSG